MEILYNGFTLDTPPGTFPLSTDSMVLAHFVRLPRNAKVLDLGSGCGVLGVLLCAKDPGCHVTGLELDPKSHEAALGNITANGLHSRLESICCDLRSIPSPFAAGSFSVCVSNPPYFSGGEASRTVPLARRDDCCSPEELMCAASRALQYGGDFYLVHKPDKLAQLIGCAARESLETKRLLLVRHRPDAPVAMIALHCRKGAKPGLIWQELCLHNADGSFSDEYRSIYHI